MDRAQLVGFRDEMTKISGELQGHVRSGRRPMHVETLLAKEKADEHKDRFLPYVGDNATAVLAHGGDDTAKQASASPPISKQLKRVGGTMLAGGILTEAAIRANQDRKLGKQMRQQQQGY